MLQTAPHSIRHVLFHLVPKHTFVNTKEVLGISACVYVKVKVDAYQICQKIII